jgi:hypothetical protein
MHEVPDHDPLAVGADIGGGPVRYSLQNNNKNNKNKNKNSNIHLSFLAIQYNTATAFGLQQSAQASTARV